MDEHADVSKSRTASSHCPLNTPSHEVLMQYATKCRYLKRVDHFASAHISTFLTPTSTRFMLLHLPHPPNQYPQTPQLTPTTFPPFAPYTSIPSTSSTPSISKPSSSSGSTGIPNNATSPQAEEAIRGFFGEVFEVWIKAIMNPFTSTEDKIVSPVFRQRIIAAGKKYL